MPLCHVDTHTKNYELKNTFKQLDNCSLVIKNYSIFDKIDFATVKCSDNIVLVVVMQARSYLIYGL